MSHESFLEYIANFGKSTRAYSRQRDNQTRRNIHIDKEMNQKRRNEIHAFIYDVIAKLTDYRVDKPYKLSQDF